MAASPRDPNVRIGMDPSKYVAGAEKVSWATKQMLREQERADRQYRSMQSAHQAALDEEARRQREAARVAEEAEQRKRQAYEFTGRALVTGGAAIAAGLGLAAKGAMDWESAWTGVTKTVDGTPDQLAEIEDGLRGLARELPASHQEIAAVAEAAGQLGISSENVVDFTRTMINLGETTNLSAEEAATSLARFSNVMGTSESEVSNLGSAIVGLGNNFQTTEAEIVSMGMRISGAGRQAGMTEGEVLGLATALSSVGIEAEAGGTAISTTMTTIGMEVDTNGAKLETFAAVAGMSADEFATAWRDDAAGALAAFITGLDDTSALGQTTNEVLADLGITGIREADSLRRMSASHDTLNEALALGNESFAENNALTEEAAKRYETAEAKIQIAWNAIKDAGIGIGETFLPALADSAEAVADLAGWFADLPEPVQRTIAILGGVASAAALAGGSFLLLAPRTMDAVNAARELAKVSPRVDRGLTRVRNAGSRVTPVLGKASKAAGAAAAAFTALQVASSFVEIDTTSVSQWTDGLLDMSDAADAASLSLKGVSDGTYDDKLYSIGDAIERIDNPSAWQSFVDGFNKVTGYESNAELLKDELEGIGQALATMYDSDPDLAAERFELILAETGLTTDELLEKLPAYRDALLDTDNAQQLAADGAGVMADGMDTATESTDEATEAAEEFSERATAAFESFIDPAGAFQAAIDKNREFAEETAAATEDAEDSWEDYYDGQSVSAKDYISQLREQVTAQENWRDNLISISERVNEGMTGEMRAAANGMIEELMDLGPEGAAQVELLEGMSDKQLRRVVRLYQRKGSEASTEFESEIAGTRPPTIDVNVSTGSALAAIGNVHSQLNSLNGRRVTAYVETVQYGQGRVATGGLIGFNGGGVVPGVPPSDPMADNVPAVNVTTGARYMIRSGEYVQSQPAVDHYGVDVMAAMNARRVPKEVFMGLAGGGQVMDVASHYAPQQPALPAGGGASPAGGMRVVQHINVKYPINEPTSVTTNKALQYAAAIGEL